MMTSGIPSVALIDDLCCENRDLRIHVLCEPFFPTHKAVEVFIAARPIRRRNRFAEATWFFRHPAQQGYLLAARSPQRRKGNEKESPNHRSGSDNRTCPFAICRPREEFQGAHLEDRGGEDASQEAYVQTLDQIYLSMFFDIKEDQMIFQTLKI